MPKLLEKVLIFLFFCCVIFLIIFVYSRGILFYDEGWILHPALRVLQGDVPYRDFHYIYTPGSIYITALSFIVFGQSIFATRIMLFIITILTLLAILYIAKFLKFGRFATVVSVGLFVAWLPLQINFSWPVVYVALTYFMTIITIILFREKHNFKYLVLTGIAGFLTFFFKQNFGVAVTLSSIIFLLFFENRKLKPILYFLLGLIGSLIIWILYLLFTNSFIPLLKDTYTFFILGKGVLATPFIYPAPFLIELLKSIFYLLPLIISLFAIYLVRNKNRNLIIIPLFGFFFYLFGIRPTTDFTHFIPLLAVTGPTAGIIFENLVNKSSKFVIVILTTGIIFLGIYTTFFRNYYTWNPSIINYNLTVNNSRVGVFVDYNSKYSITYLQAFINNQTNENDYIFVTRFQPLLYFLLNRRNPTKYEFLNPYLNSPDVDKEIITNLKQKNVKIIIVDYSIKDDKRPISKYIEKNYSPIKVDSWPVWVKK